jgi:hypothetical protein
LTEVLFLCIPRNQLFCFLFLFEKWKENETMRNNAKINETNMQYRTYMYVLYRYM